MTNSTKAKPSKPPRGKRWLTPPNGQVMELFPLLGGSRPGNTTRARVRALTAAGSEKLVEVALDSFSARDMVHQSLARGKRKIAPVILKGVGGTKEVAEEAGFVFLHDGRQLEVEGALVDDGSTLPRGCLALLSSKTLNLLRVDMNWHLEMAAKGRHSSPLRLRKAIFDRKEVLSAWSPSEVLGGRSLGKSTAEVLQAPEEAKLPPLGVTVEEERRHPLQRLGEPSKKDENSVRALAHETSLRALADEIRRMTARELKDARQASLPPQELYGIELRQVAQRITRLADAGRWDEAEELGGIGALTEIYLALENEASPHARQRWPWLSEVSEMYISDQRVGEFLARVGGKLPRPPKAMASDIKTYDGPIRGETPAESSRVREALQDVARKFSDVFTRKNDLPKPLNAVPHIIPLKPGAKKCWTPQPRSRPNTNEFLHQYYSQGLASGLYEYPKGATNASMTVLAHKNGPGGKDDPNFKVRPCANLVRVNDQIEKMPPPVVRIEDLINKHKGATRFWGSDAYKAYHGVVVAKKSRGLLATWAGPLGLVQPTRMPFGYINAGTVLHQVYCEQLKRRLPPSDLKHISILVDDFLISDVDAPGMQFVERVRRFLAACRAAGITLSPGKTRAGFPSAKFAGYEITGKGTRVAHDSLAPLRTCRAPSTQSGVRRTLGLFQTSSRYIKNYSIIAKPLTRLTGKVPWRWRKEVEGVAFARLKKAVLERPNLHTPDYAFPFWLRVDASDLGKGAVLYQKIPLSVLEPEERRRWDKASYELKCPVDDQILQRDEIGKYAVHVVRYASQAYSKGQLSWPIYYKETEAIFWAFRKMYWYLSMSKFPVEVESDHVPTRYVKHSVKGPVTTWAAEMHPLQWNLHVIPGLSNITADALSRSPILEIPPYRLHGPDGVWQKLLEKLPDQCASAKRVWVYAGAETTLRCRLVQQWRSGKQRNALLRCAPSSPPSDYELALIAPRAKLAPKVCAELLRADKPFACLIPSDLVGWTAVAEDGRNDAEVLAKLEKCAKLAALNADMVWVVHRIEMQDSVFSAEEVERESSRRAHWIALQQEEAASYRKFYGPTLATREDGMCVVVHPDEPVRIVVPESERRALVFRTHRELHHQGFLKVFNVLRLTYTWPNMRADTRRWLKTCLPCAISKFKIRTAHGQYRAFKVERPGIVYGFDFFELNGDKIFVWVDMFSRCVGYEPIPSLQASDIAQVVVDEIIHRRGVPHKIYSDAEPGLVGRVFRSLREEQGIDHHTVATRWSQGNAIAERHQYILGEYARRCDPNDRAHAASRTNLRHLAFCVNRTPNETHGLAAFEIELGYLPRLAVESGFVDMPDDVDVRWSNPGSTAAPTAQLAVNRRLFMDVARQRIQHSQAYQLQRLNAKGFRPRTYQRGDLCVIYLPPAGGRDGKWKAKHIPQAVGPCEVLSRKGAFYTVRHVASGRTYDRNVAMIAPFYGSRDAVLWQPSEATKPIEEYSLPELKAVSPIAVLDEAGGTIASLAEPTAIRNGRLHVHYYVTQGRKWPSAIFALGFQETKNRRTKILMRPPRRDERARPFTGELPLDADLVVATGLKFKSKNAERQPRRRGRHHYQFQLTAASARRLAQYRPLRV